MIRTTEEFPTEYRQRNIRIFSEGWNDTVKKKGKRIIFIILEDKIKDQQ